jgi:hypothetical protein
MTPTVLKSKPIGQYQRSSTLKVGETSAEPRAIRQSRMPVAKIQYSRRSNFHIRFVSLSDALRQRVNGH